MVNENQWQKWNKMTADELSQEFSDYIFNISSKTYMNWIAKRGLGEAVEQHIIYDFENQNKDGRRALLKALDELTEIDNREDRAIRDAIRYYLTEDASIDYNITYKENCRILGELL